MTTLLTLEQAACERGGRLLWSGLSLRLDEGMLIHVTGGNGIGKSSLLRMAAGLLPPAAGRVERSVAADLVDELPALDTRLPLARALDFWARLAPAPVAVDVALDRVGIAHIAPVPVRMLSTGQRKRAALARLLLSGAPLWLLDEPANGLDSDGVVMLANLIEHHRAGGGGVLLASHQSLPIASTQTITLAEFRP